MKKLLCLGLLLALLTAGCQHMKDYRDDVSCEAITDAVCDELEDEEYLPFGEEQIRFSFENTDRFADYSLVYSVRSENIDEIGIFRGETQEDVDELRRLCEQYVTTLHEEQRAFVASYAPREAAKLDAATVRVFGHYVIYTVLSEDDREESYEKIQELLEP